MSQISERCSCGASIDFRTKSPSELRAVSEAWRTDHRHEFPPPPSLPDLPVSVGPVDEENA